MTVRMESIGAFKSVVLENARIKAVMLPELGGKMVSLMAGEGSVEFLLQPPEPERGYRRAKYGSSFEEYDTSGFDECIPTVSECTFSPQDQDGSHPPIHLPDHGELWSIPWSAAVEGEKVILKAAGTNLPYTLEKRIRLDGSTVIIEYELENRGSSGFDYLWSAHPLLEVEEGDNILLPIEVRELFLNWSRDDRLGTFGFPVSWPRARTSAGLWDDLSVIKGRDLGTADKLYTGRLESGFCGFYRRRANMSLVFRFEPEQAPYVGIWICQGGWPTSRAAKHYTVAVEPCSGRPDALDQAAKMNSCQRILAGETKHWTLSMEIREGIAIP